MSGEFDILCEGSNRDHIEVENNAMRYLWIKSKLSLDDKEIDDLMHAEEAEEIGKRFDNLRAKLGDWRSVVAVAESLLEKHDDTLA